mmetsp:Transcript_37377/g.72033  ORF Transcript_37377/g.72033 Transcript_37377/m.72033 type:complete len:143 (+) Transcript_37377:1-429(+)
MEASFDDVLDSIAEASSPLSLKCLRVEDIEQPEQPKAAETVTVSVLTPEGETVEFEAKTGDVLREALLENDVDVYDWYGKGMNCGGAGSCLTCLVQVDNDGCGERTDYENKRLKNKPDNWRLACQSTIEGPTTLKTKPQTRK